MIYGLVFAEAKRSEYIIYTLSNLTSPAHTRTGKEYGGDQAPLMSPLRADNKGTSPASVTAFVQHSQ